MNIIQDMNDAAERLRKKHFHVRLAFLFQDGPGFWTAVFGDAERLVEATDFVVLETFDGGELYSSVRNSQLANAIESLLELEDVDCVGVLTTTRLDYKKHRCMLKIVQATYTPELPKRPPLPAIQRELPPPPLAPVSQPTPDSKPQEVSKPKSEKAAPRKPQSDPPIRKGLGWKKQHQTWSQEKGKDHPH